MSDVNDPDWKVVRQREPRSGCVTLEPEGQTLSVGGRVDATTMSAKEVREDIEHHGGAHAKVVPRTEVKQVMAGEECDEEDAPYADTDYVDSWEDNNVEV